MDNTVQIEIYYWGRPLSPEEYESLDLTYPREGESFEEWFAQNFLDNK